MKKPIGHSIILHLVLLFCLLINFNFVKKETLEEIPSTPISISLTNPLPQDKATKKIFSPRNSVKPVTLKNSSPRIESAKSELNDNSKQKFDNLISGIKKNIKKKNTTKSANERFNKLFQDKLLKDLEKSNKEKKEEQSEPETQNEQDIHLSTQEEDEIRNQIIPNWIIPAGIKDAENLIIEVLVEIAPDGTILRTKVLNQSDETNFKIAAQSAERALILSSPLTITSKRLKKLKEFIFHFNPKDVL